MKRISSVLFLFILQLSVLGQTPSRNAGEIYQAIKKLNVLGSVLYIAAHPDDENTRLIAYLANEKLYRTGYLSLTRGDGGQNLIGDEQGVELGLIRTQELLAARRIDGGKQFFSSAYDFGYSKTPEETFQIWGKEKILADVVWVIRRFQPDVIITRFPVTGEGGHGHHTASAILANEAFAAAADATRFPEQLKYVRPWQAKRVLWNTFNFGGNNTTSPSQFSINTGGFNPLLGKSYGEIDALSRSQHKSQGFGAAATRGDAREYFKTTAGSTPEKDILDDVDISWNRIGDAGKNISGQINSILQSFDLNAPQKSVPALAVLYKAIAQLPESHWQQQKLSEVQELILQCSGLFIEATSAQPYAVQTDSLSINITANNQLGADIKLIQTNIDGQEWIHNIVLAPNQNNNFSQTIPVPLSKPITQPYWLRQPMAKGHFNIDDQRLIGRADIEYPFNLNATLNIDGVLLTVTKPVMHRYTDPVKGELYQPLYIVPPATLTLTPSLLLFNKNTPQQHTVQATLHANKTIKEELITGLTGAFAKSQTEIFALQKGDNKTCAFNITSLPSSNTSEIKGYAHFKNNGDTTGYRLALRTIAYDHIPVIKYFYPAQIKALDIDLKIMGKKIGYIPGAGDKVPDILKLMGYDVTTLDRETLGTARLSGFDAIITGVRAYNTNEWLNDFYPALMNYVQQGGNLIVQYNTSTNIGPIKARIGPYDFNISRNRITDESAAVTFLKPSHPVFNYPNKISQADFEGWIQERSIYHAVNWDNHFTPLLSMADPGESPDTGSLITTKYGKGVFTYAGIVFFRELPAGVPGAMRLLANLIALNKTNVK
ncbi:MAG: PIG-L family deacetylase [Niabella sp.]